jgi:hypothetical protein
LGLAQQRGAADPAPVVAAVSGTVFDSVRMAPLWDAVVRVVNAESPADAPVTASTDSLGRFALGALPTGRYVATFSHPAVDALGVQAPTYVVVVADSTSVALPMATFSAGSVRAVHCGPQAVGDSTGVVVGFLRDARDRLPVAGGAITARWVEVVVGARALRQEVATRAARTGESGWFALCGVPLGTDVPVQAAHGGDSSGVVRLRTTASGFVRRDLYVGVATYHTSVPPAMVDTATGSPVERADGGRTAAARRGVGRVVGVVRAAGGGPVRSARLLVLGSGIEATTDAEGRFVLRGLPEGTRTLAARAVGYFPEELPVDVFADGADTVRVALNTVRRVLDTLRIVATAVDRGRLAFNERRRAFSGTFLDAERIDRAIPIFVSDLFRQASGITVVPMSSPDMQGTVYMLRVRGGGGFAATGRQLCLPLVFIDGMRFALQYDLRELDQLVAPRDLQSVEFYPGVSAPVQFNRTNNCASIVITTKWH